MLQRSSEGEYEPYYCIPVHYGEGQQGLIIILITKQSLFLFVTRLYSL